jgi:hypothetical protein
MRLTIQDTRAHLDAPGWSPSIINRVEVVVCGHIDHVLLILIQRLIAGMHTPDRLDRESHPAEQFRNSVRNLRFRTDG